MLMSSNKIISTEMYMFFLYALCYYPVHHSDGSEHSIPLLDALPPTYGKHCLVFICLICSKNSSSITALTGLIEHAGKYVRICSLQLPSNCIADLFMLECSVLWDVTL
jgi:hypothetical protein